MKEMKKKDNDIKGIKEGIKGVKVLCPRDQIFPCAEN
jgi:hypothetical protein